MMKDFNNKQNLLCFNLTMKHSKSNKMTVLKMMGKIGTKIECQFNKLWQIDYIIDLIVVYNHECRER